MVHLLMKVCTKSYTVTYIIRIISTYPLALYSKIQGDAIEDFTMLNQCHKKDDIK